MPPNLGCCCFRGEGTRQKQLFFEHLLLSPCASSSDSAWTLNLLQNRRQIPIPLRRFLNKGLKHHAFDIFPPLYQTRINQNFLT